MIIRMSLGYLADELFVGGCASDGPLTMLALPFGMTDRIDPSDNNFDIFVEQSIISARYLIFFF
jgi:hypothetical protein